MRLDERRCEVCGGPVDHEQTSTHHARVVWLCTADGLDFHARESEWRWASSTAECLERIATWVAVTRAVTPA
jgi:hypothetical protein